jgi:hypothetical protein
MSDGETQLYQVSSCRQYLPGIAKRVELRCQSNQGYNGGRCSILFLYRIMSSCARNYDVT